jgi:hypothetical protein
VLRIRIGFIPHPNPAFFLNAHPDPGQGRQTSVDPDLVRLCRHKKLNFIFLDEK